MQLVTGATGHIFTLFTPLYYRMNHQKPRLTSYSLKTLQSNARISHAKAGRELGYVPRALRRSIGDAIQWFRNARSNTCFAIKPT